MEKLEQQLKIKRYKSLICVSFFLNVFFVFLIFCIGLKTDLIDQFLIKIGSKKKVEIPFEYKSEYHLIESWANSLSKMDVNADVVFYGNSITYESDFQKYFPDIVICNMGCKGDDLDDLINRSFLISSVHPKKIFILGGINDFSQISLDTFKEKYHYLVNTIKQRNPNSQIFLQSLLPVNVNLLYGRQYINCISKIKCGNDIIKEIATTSGLYYIDLYSRYQENDSLPYRFTNDGLHLKQSAYSVWANCIANYLY